MVCGLSEDYLQFGSTLRTTGGSTEQVWQRSWCRLEHCELNKVCQVCQTLQMLGRKLIQIQFESIWRFSLGSSCRWAESINWNGLCSDSEQQSKLALKVSHSCDFCSLVHAPSWNKTVILLCETLIWLRGVVKKKLWKSSQPDCFYLWKF